MKHIRLSLINETMEEDGDENSEMRNCIGSHLHCNGYIDLKEVSNTHNALLCRSCGLRITIPNAIKTYKDLRRYMSAMLKM